MLVDDNKYDNYYHERIIRNGDYASVIVAKTSAVEALGYLINKERTDYQHPDIIFLDINMPGMNGWEFLDEYDRLDAGLKSKVIIVMLTTSENPDDQAKALSYPTLSGFRTKPLTAEMLDEILNKYF